MPPSGWCVIGCLAASCKKGSCGTAHAYSGSAGDPARHFPSFLSLLPVGGCLAANYREGSSGSKNMCQFSVLSKLQAFVVFLAHWRRAWGWLRRRYLRATQPDSGLQNFQISNRPGMSPSGASAAITWQRAAEKAPATQTCSFRFMNTSEFQDRPSCSLSGKSAAAWRSAAEKAACGAAYVIQLAHHDECWTSARRLHSRCRGLPARYPRT